MDRHDIPSITAEQVAQAHLVDLSIAPKHGVQFLTYWFDAAAGAAFCLARAESPGDLAAVHRLARYAAGPDGDVPVLDVVPLFETFADLQAAPRILAEIVQHPAFAERLAATGRRLEVMLGYSDSSKDVGPVAANLALYEAQAGLRVAVAWGYLPVGAVDPVLEALDRLGGRLYGLARR